MKKNIGIFLLMVVFCSAQSQDKTSNNQAIYKEIPEVVSKINQLKSNTAVDLGKFQINPVDAKKYNGSFSTGPGRRDYCNKMPYAPDRGTAVYSGANHGSPNRLNDVWEYHLGSNTWNLICLPGNDATLHRQWENKARKAREDISKQIEVEKNKSFLENEFAEFNKNWWSKCAVEDGYLQDKANGGPVQPWHTWDGITYDIQAKRLYWAVLDSDNTKIEKDRVQVYKTKLYAEATGKAPEELVALLKPSSSLFMYDFEKKRWFRQLGEAPFPYMRGMGGSLIYLSDIDKTIWYNAAQNVPLGEFCMWEYDAKTNKWKDLKPNEGKSLIDSTFGPYVNGKRDPTQIYTPEAELQMAYSPKFKKIVAVSNEKTFVYDVAKNSWVRGEDTLGFGQDNHGVFVYDSNADVFLLASKSGGIWSKKPWTICAYDVKNNKWEQVEILGDAMRQDTESQPNAFAGYYDIGYNAFVLYNGRNATTWAYRHKSK